MSVVAGWYCGRVAGFDVRHAQEMVDLCGLHPDLCLCKPEHPIKPDTAIAVLGHSPLMQFDDDPTEQVGGWPFLLVLEDGSISQA